MTFELADLPTAQDLEAIANASREDIEDGLRRILGKEYPGSSSNDDASWKAGTLFDNGSSFYTPAPQESDPSHQMLANPSEKTYSNTVTDRYDVYPDQGNPHSAHCDHTLVQAPYRGQVVIEHATEGNSMQNGPESLINMNLVAHLQEQPFRSSGTTTVIGALDRNDPSSTTNLHSNVIGNWIEFPNPTMSESAFGGHNEMSNFAFEPSNLGQYTFANSVSGFENSCILSGSRPGLYYTSNYAEHEGSMQFAATDDPSLLFPPSTNEFQVGSSSDILNVVAPMWETNPLWFSEATSPECSSSIPISNRVRSCNKGKKALSSISKDTRRGELPSKGPTSRKRKMFCTNRNNAGIMCGVLCSDERALARHRECHCKFKPLTEEDKLKKKMILLCPAGCKDFSRPDSLHRHLVLPRRRQEECFTKALNSNLGWDPKIPSSCKVFYVPDPSGINADNQ